MPLYESTINGGRVTSHAPYEQKMLIGQLNHLLQ